MSRKLASGGIALLVSLALASTIVAQEGAAPERLFELRTYVAAEGKIEDLHSRFRDHTTRLFEKHGMTVIGYWMPTQGEGADKTLVYLLAFPSQEARGKAWSAFMNDPEWKRVYEESHKNGPLVEKLDSKLLDPTDYSPLK
jgi:hypothetical protein